MFLHRRGSDLHIVVVLFLMELRFLPRLTYQETLPNHNPLLKTKSFFKYFNSITNISGGSNRGGARDSSRSNSFYFHAVFGKRFFQIIDWCLISWNSEIPAVYNLVFPIFKMSIEEITFQR